jgi:hypothetical protein
MRRARAIQRRKNLLFDREVLRHCLDDKARITHERLQARASSDSSTRRGRLLRGELTEPLDAIQAALNIPQRFVESCLAARVQVDIVAMRGEILRDAMPHETGTDDRNRSKFASLHQVSLFNSCGCVSAMCALSETIRTGIGNLPRQAA